MSDDPPSNKLGQRLRQLRHHAGMSQTALAQELEVVLAPSETVTQSAVSQWELGESFPSPSKLRAFAEVTGADVDELLRLRAGVTHHDDDRTDQLPAGLRAKLSALDDRTRERVLARLEGWLDAELDRRRGR